MLQNRKTLVLFDIGAVQIRLNYINFFDEAAKVSTKSREEFRRDYIESKLEKRVIDGEVETVAENLAELRELLASKEKLSDEQLKALMANFFGDPIAETIELKEKLFHAGYSVGTFSNISQLAIELIKEAEPKVFEIYDPSFPHIFSFQHKLLKPMPEMYQLVTGYDKVIYIDDRLRYVNAGVEHGWHGIWFTPFIDKLETLRLEDEVTEPARGIIRADNFQEVVSALKKFGIEI